MKLVQVSDKVHKSLKLLATKEGITLKQLVERLLIKVTNQR